MRALRPIRLARHSGLGDSLKSLLAQFSAATLELNPSIGAQQISQRLTERAQEMLGARAAVLALAGAEEWEIAALTEPQIAWTKAVAIAPGRSLAEHATRAVFHAVSESAAKFWARELAAASGWREVLLARLTAQEGRTLGVLCLADSTHPLSPAESQFLEALASHASVALENVRMFGRIELSRKQWVEDFDAISDFIVVHDAAGKVLRLNRALADVLEVHPQRGHRLGCCISWSCWQPNPQGDARFAANLSVPKEEFTHQAATRTYVISTSRINSGRRRTAHHSRIEGHHRSPGSRAPLSPRARFQ